MSDGWLITLLLGVPALIALMLMPGGSTQEPGAMLLVVIVAACAFGLYFLPVIVASRRNHSDTLPIFLVVFFFGWTLLGWVFALVWACREGDRRALPNASPKALIPASNSDLKACPECAETILAAARKCKHCGSVVA